jgi:hypothetical protein
MRMHFPLVTALALAPGTGALAGSNVTCTAEPPSKWIREADMKSRIAAMGYEFDVFKTTRGSCYEIYGRDSNGKRIEVYFDPVTGDVVKAFK